jgi:acetyl-CoA carboxylase carboxyltransferase component
MPVLTSLLDTSSPTYASNREAQLAVLDQLDEQLAKAVAGGGEHYTRRHRERGKLPVRERLELLLDPDSPFLELSALAAWGTGFAVGASMLTGIGVVSGVECMVIGHDPTVRGGAMNPYSLRKTLRALEIARHQPAAGGQPGRVRRGRPAQPGRPVRAGRADLPRAHRAVRAGHPDRRPGVRQLHAGGAYVPGMCDHAVLVDRRAKVFLAGRRW